MRNMKDSGIEWIGEIPKDWEVIRLKIICDLENGFSFKSCDYIEESNTLCCRMSNIRPNGVFDISYSKIYLPDSYVSKYKSYLLKDKDIIIAMTDMANAPKILGVPTEVKTDGYNLLLNQRVGKLIIKNNSINTLFLKYSMSSESSKYYFTLLSDKNIQINLSKENLLNMFITYPSLEEQELIANYLDSKVSEIDNIISKTKETIEEYKKYKQSVITEAVTKGLNPNVEMKDSGIEWIGEIPKDWIITKVKHLSLVSRGASPRPIDDSKYFDENGEYVWTRIADISKCNKYFTKHHEYMSELGSSKTVKIEENTLFLSICATVGKPIISKVKCCIHDGFVYFPELNKKYNEFLYYIFESGLCFKGLGKMGTQLNLNTETVGNISVPLPSDIEMNNIINFINKKCSKLDNLITKKEELITQLEAYKKSLIYECVTGKKEVSSAYAY